MVVSLNSCLGKFVGLLFGKGSNQDFRIKELKPSRRDVVVCSMLHTRWYQPEASKTVSARHREYRQGSANGHQLVVDS